MVLQKNLILRNKKSLKTMYRSIEEIMKLFLKIIEM